MTQDQKQALQFLFDNACQSRTLPPAAFPDVQKAASLILNALEEKKEEVKEKE